MSHFTSNTETDNNYYLDSMKFSSRKWNFDFNTKSKSERYYSNTSALANTSQSQSGSVSTVTETLPSPPGYLERFTSSHVVNTADATITAKRSWDIALGPIKQLPMNVIIMWMAGSSISIFPIVMVIMMFIRPLQAIFQIQSTIQMIEGRQAPIQCIVYLLGNILSLMLAVYKCHQMGLLPTYASDWLAFVEPPANAEWAAGGFSLF